MLVHFAYVICFIILLVGFIFKMIKDFLKIISPDPGDSTFANFIAFVIDFIFYFGVLYFYLH